MFNVLLDNLPSEYEGFLIDSDFQTGIQIFQVLNDEELSQQERVGTALSLLFPNEKEDECGNIVALPIPDINTAIDGLQWFLSDWYHDKPTDSDKERVTDYDIDQWRIYSAFRSQYGINLNTDKLHFWEFMGLLTTLDECAYTRVIDIRQKKITAKMSEEEKRAIREAKKIYSIQNMNEEITEKEREAIDVFRSYIKARR